MAAGQVTFVGQSAVVAAGELAIAAFQRYASIRIRKGLLPKRSECLDALEMSQKLMGLYDVGIHTGRPLSDQEVLAALKR